MKPSKDILNACLFDPCVENFHKLAISCVESYKNMLGYYDYFNSAPSGSGLYHVCKMKYRGYFSRFKFAEYDSRGTLIFQANAIAEVEGDEYRPSAGNELTEYLIEKIKTEVKNKAVEQLRAELDKELAPFCNPSDLKTEFRFHWKTRLL